MRFIGYKERIAAYIGAVTQQIVWFYSSLSLSDVSKCTEDVFNPLFPFCYQLLFQTPTTLSCMPTMSCPSAFKALGPP